MQVTVKQGTFDLPNQNKLDRVIEPITGASGQLIEGLGHDAKHEDILVAYDKIAGYIRGKEGSKVKPGCFYDHKTGKAFDDPKVIYTFRINARTVEVPADEAFPVEVQAKQKQDQDKEKETKKKKNK